MSKTFSATTKPDNKIVKQRKTTKQHSTHSHSQIPTNIVELDQSLQNIEITEDWKWVGLVGKMVYWMQHLLRNHQSARYSTNICNIGTDVHSYENFLWTEIEIDKHCNIVSSKYDLNSDTLCWIKKHNNKKLSALPLMIQINFQDKTKEQLLHVNMLLLDHKNKTIERFEPNGCFWIQHSETQPRIDIDPSVVEQVRPLDSIESAVDLLFRALVHKHFRRYTYIETSKFCPETGPQKLAIQEATCWKDKGRFCVPFSLLYFHLRICNPNMTLQEVVNQITQDGGSATHERIVRYARWIDMTVPHEKSTSKEKKEFEKLYPIINL